MKFEEKLKRLEEIRDRLQSEEIPLDEALNLYGEAKRLLEECKDELDSIKGKIEVVKINEDQ